MEPPGANEWIVYVARRRNGTLCFVGRTRYFESRAADHAKRRWTIEEVLRADLQMARNVEEAVLTRGPEGVGGADR